MTWATTTPGRIVAAIDGQSDHFTFSQVKGAMDRAFDSAEIQVPGTGGNQLVAQIEGWLTRIESYDTQLDGGASNAGLIKADVLEWERGGGRLKGLRQERSRYVRRLVLALGLQGFEGSVSGQGRLVRS